MGRLDKASTNSQWLDSGNGYELTISDGEIRARNKKGKVLKSVPAAVKKTDAFADLNGLRAWLRNHDAECGITVETWLLRALPVPTAVLAEVWKDEAWRSWLYDLVIHPADNNSVTGFLRDARADKGAPQVSVVDLEGETRTINAKEVSIPHPVLFEEREALQEFAADLGVDQRFDQLFRAVYPRPEKTASASQMRLDTWSDARFEKSLFGANRARQAGFRVRGGYAVTHINEGDRLMEARYWIGADQAPEAEAITGELQWTVNDDPVPVQDVGPISYSEGVRMATYIHAGRTIEEEA